MNEQTFASGTARNIASAFLAFFWLVVEIGLVLFGVFFVEFDTETFYYYVLPVFCLYLIYIYAQRTIVQLRLHIMVNSEGVTITKGKNSKMYSFREYHISTDVSQNANSFSFGLMSYLAGTKNQILITNKTGFNKKIVTHLSNSVFEELQDRVKIENKKIEDELVKSMKGNDVIPIKKEFKFNKSKLRSGFIMSIIFLILPFGILGLLFTASEADYDSIIISFVIFGIVFWLLGFMLLIIFWFQYRRYPKTVRIDSDTFFINDKQFNVHSVSKMRVTSTLKVPGAGFRYVYFTYEGKKFKYYFGRNSDTKMNKSILILEDYKEIVAYFKAKFESRPDVLQED